MSAVILAAAALAAATAALLVVLAQPVRAWRDAAEHRRAFWVGWDLAATAVGAVGLVVAGLGWAGAGWITFWCVVGSLQPAMIADVRDVRRLLRRARPAPGGAPPVEPAVAPIRWHAAGLGVPPAGDRLVAAGSRRRGA